MAKPKLTFEQQLDSIPVINRRLEVAEAEDGKSLEVGVELRYRGLAKVFKAPLKLRSVKRYQLQGVGLDVFRSIDGEKTFEQLIDDFAVKHKLTFLESRALLMQYIQMLMQRGIVSIAVKKNH